MKIGQPLWANHVLALLGRVGELACRYSDLRPEILQAIVRGTQMMPGIGKAAQSDERYRTPTQMADEVLKACEADAAATGPLRETNDPRCAILTPELPGSFPQPDLNAQSSPKKLALLINPGSQQLEGCLGSERLGTVRCQDKRTSE